MHVQCSAQTFKQKQGPEGFFSALALFWKHNLVIWNFKIQGKIQMRRVSEAPLELSVYSTKDDALTIPPSTISKVSVIKHIARYFFKSVHLRNVQMQEKWVCRCAWIDSSKSWGKLQLPSKSVFATNWVLLPLNEWTALSLENLERTGGRCCGGGYPMQPLASSPVLQCPITHPSPTSVNLLCSFAC